MNMYSNFCKLQDAAFAINGVCEYLYGVEYKADEVDKIYQQLKDIQKRVQAYASGARLEVTAQERGGFAKQMAVDPNHGVSKCSVVLHRNPAAFVCLGQVERSSIPTDA